MILFFAHENTLHYLIILILITFLPLSASSEKIVPEGYHDALNKFWQSSISTTAMTVAIEHYLNPKPSASEQTIATEDIEPTPPTKKEKPTNDPTCEVKKISQLRQSRKIWGTKEQSEKEQGKRPHACNKCQWAFKEQRHLFGHAKTHLTQ